MNTEFCTLQNKGFLSSSGQVTFRPPTLFSVTPHRCEDRMCLQFTCLPPKRGFDPILRTHTATSLSIQRHSSRFMKIRHVLFWDADAYIDQRIAIVLWVSNGIITTDLLEGHLVVLYQRGEKTRSLR